MYENIVIFVIFGFIAQIIDGTLGMGYGVSLTSFLMGLGIAPAIASATVHMSEVFTTCVSGIFHLKFGNVDKKLFVKLVVPGIIGGILGAYILTSISGKTIKPFVAIYLLIMGIMILIKTFREIAQKEIKTNIVPLGFIGGFFDAIGGGGWGPIVTSTLVARGNNPRVSIGSVTLAEFFVTTAQALTFLTILGFVNGKIIVGLIIGSAISAPLAAYICKRIKPKALMAMVGILIIILSAKTLYQSFFM